MKFTVLTIPEGVVTKITCGGVVLWQKTTALVCAPYIELTIVQPLVSSGQYIEYGRVSCKISGISNELINELEFCYIMSTQGTSHPGTKTINLTGADTVTGCSRAIEQNTMFSYAGYLKLTFTDLNGKTQTITTTTISKGTTSAQYVEVPGTEVTPAICGIAVSGVTICGDYEEVTA